MCLKRCIAVSSIRTNGGITSKFPIKIGLHLRATLSPYLFAFIKDGSTRLIQAKVLIVYGFCRMISC
jgi:hypothetical protein